MDDDDLSFADLREMPQVWSDRPDGVVLEGVVGSQAYGLAREDSDEDRIGIFLAPSEEFLGLDAVGETVKNPWSDEVLHEAGKFCRLALKVNPTVTELLWLDEHLVRTDVGYQLITLRSAFLSAAYCRNAYLGYATSQFGKLKDRGDGSFSSDLRTRTAKHARHLARLLVSGYGLWSTGYLQVRLENPQWFHEFGDRVADGDLDVAQELLTRYETMFAETPTVLPAEPDRRMIDAWLKSTRRGTLVGVKSA